LQTYLSDRFSGDFAEIWHLMQTPYSKEDVNLHQIPNLGEIAQKRSTGILQFPQ
jgi:hypothetical protein